MKHWLWSLLSVAVVIMLLATAAIILTSGEKASLQAQEEQGEMKMPKSKLLDHARDDLRAAKAAKGTLIVCCVKPACDMCPLASNMCPCRGNAAKGNPVCGQCKMGWMAGHGRLRNIKPEDVKTGGMEMGIKMRKMRVMMEPEEKK